MIIIFIALHLYKIVKYIFLEIQQHLKQIISHRTHCNKTYRLKKARERSNEDTEKENTVNRKKKKIEQVKDIIHIRS
jgi:hypothetical protein